MKVKKPDNDAPREIITKPWQRHVLREGDAIDFHAYTFCFLSELRIALRRRDVFVARAGGTPIRRMGIHSPVYLSHAGPLGGAGADLDCAGGR